MRRYRGFVVRRQAMRALGSLPSEPRTRLSNISRDVRFVMVGSSFYVRPSEMRSMEHGWSHHEKEKTCRQDDVLIMKRPRRLQLPSSQKAMGHRHPQNALPSGMGQVSPYSVGVFPDQPWSSTSFPKGDKAGPKRLSSSPFLSGLCHGHVQEVFKSFQSRDGVFLYVTELARRRPWFVAPPATVASRLVKQESLAYLPLGSHVPPKVNNEGPYMDNTVNTDFDVSLTGFRTSRGPPWRAWPTANLRSSAGWSNCLRICYAQGSDRSVIHNVDVVRHASDLHAYMQQHQLMELRPSVLSPRLLGELAKFGSISRSFVNLFVPSRGLSREFPERKPFNPSLS
ncbi:hypothetical protein VNO77_43973 [Canavalia gladiata]|uniref:Uncharacterized protein n=1 Tax=Canavalia gladiata TaxID=3824 RepID=A0AAN9JX78_CANGL